MMPERELAAERFAFLHGDCWVLAFTMCRMFGFDPWFAVIWDKKSSDFRSWSWDHVFVETHSGHPLDIEGAASVERWRKTPFHDHERGFATTVGDEPLRRHLFEDYADERYRHNEPKRLYPEQDVYAAITRLAHQSPEAFQRLPQRTLGELPATLRSEPRIDSVKAETQPEERTTP